MRKTEELAKKPNNGSLNVNGEITAPKTTQTADLSFEMQKIKNDLSSSFGKLAKFKVGNNGKGKIELNFNSESELNAIIEKLNL